MPPSLFLPPWAQRPRAGGGDYRLPKKPPSTYHSLLKGPQQRGPSSISYTNNRSVTGKLALPQSQSDTGPANQTPGAAALPHAGYTDPRPPTRRSHCPPISPYKAWLSSRQPHAPAAET
ncbi:hypothetical protein AAFF_G00037550 [Aldrovandia affinis]|uniref:Uncharacterized protein n=1 Tax=Aldrovandia affinis TaxID=143900 RepID=A0AAD7WZD9_9TELE|nr:hypothetical protein AAFF_G00037550 [Aldrovandia affinis]